MKAFAFFVVLLVAAQFGLAQGNGLRIGTKVPTLDSVQWLYGNPATSFEPGMLYLVEFTHLDCQPCRTAIPHLTELEKKYSGRLRVISVYSYYSRDKRTEKGYRNDIAALKKRMAHRMHYTMALDTRDRSVLKRWKHEQGFPHAYLVDGGGELLWKGMGDFALLDYVVRTVLGGDTAGDRLQQRQRAFNAAYADAITNQPKRSLPHSLSVADTIIQRFPERKADGLRLKFYAYLKHDIDGANRFLSNTQAQYPDWTFNSTIFTYDRYEGLCVSLAVANFERELRQNELETATIADLLLAKGRFLIAQGHYADAVRPLQQAEFARFALGPLHPVLENMIHGAQQTAEFGVVKAYSDEAARYWLENRITAGQLNSDAAQTIRRLFEGQLTLDQHAVLEVHYREVIRELRE